MASQFKDSNKAHQSLETLGEKRAKGNLGYTKFSMRADSERPVLDIVQCSPEDIEYGMLYKDSYSKKRPIDFVHDELFTKWGFIDNTIEHYNKTVDELEVMKKNKKHPRYRFIKNAVHKKYGKGSVKTEEEFLQFVKDYSALAISHNPVGEYYKKENEILLAEQSKTKKSTYAIIIVCCLLYLFFIPIVKFFDGLFS